jgi:DNA-binding transcriptional MocR family regulator
MGGRSGKKEHTIVDTAAPNLSSAEPIRNGAPPTVAAAWLAAHITDHSARGIARAVGALIRGDVLVVGDRLPTIRALGARLGVSPATVSEAWRLLARRRCVSANGRRGTVVLGPPQVPTAHRFETIGRVQGEPRQDLRMAVPDARLLPPIREAFLQAAAITRLDSYERTPITPALRQAVSADWPFTTEEFLAVGGGFEGLLLTCRSFVAPGDRVAVEQPCAPRLLDILEAVQAEILPVARDDSGPLPAALQTALESKPVLFILQPVNSPIGTSLTVDRAQTLTEMLRTANTLVVEDDGLGPLEPDDLVSMGRWLPQRTLLVRSFSKSHGPDLRIGVIGGPNAYISQIHAYLEFGTGWTSRLIQNTLATMLTRPESRARVEHARQIYDQRRERLAAALRERGLDTPPGHGLSLWVPVSDESSALVTLASAGVLVVPGSRYFLTPPRTGFIRIATCGIRSDEPVDQLADLLALAAAADRG